MSKQDKKGLVPALRFPEFRNEEEWEETTIGKSVNFLDGQRKPIKESDRAAMQGEHPYYGASGIIDYINSFIFDEDLILLGEDGENIVSRNLPLVFKVTGKCWINNHAHVLIPKKLHHLDFLVQYMESLSYIKYNSGGAQPKLNQAVCKTIPLILPKPLEQQKIADCLSSIDELVTAQNQKLEALKAHKKGLMQQLFPADGETVPKLRFPEFRDERAWVVKQLVDVCIMQAGKFVRAVDINEKKKHDLHPCYGGNGLRGFTKTFTHIGKYSLIGRQGALCGNITLAAEKFHATEHAVVTTPKEDIDTEWLFYKLTHLNLNQYATGQAQPGLSVDNLEKVAIEVPKKEKEQQKIANCLSSIDDLITTQIQKIESLKTHKKGLMQRLFPAVDEVGV